MSWKVFALASLAFALYVLCPRMAAMVVQESKLKGVSISAVIIAGTLLSIPLFILLAQVVVRIGIEWAIILAAAADLAAALLLGSVDLRVGIELLVITVFVYAGIRLAPLITKMILKTTS